MGGMWFETTSFLDGSLDPQEIAAAMIQMGLSHTSPIRPMTMNFTGNILKATGTRLEEVRIETLKDDIFYAIARIHAGDSIREIDTHPSDAIALAVTTDSPIFVSEEILEKCGVVLPEGKTLRRMTPDTSAKMPEGLPQGEQPTTLDPSIELSKEDYEKQFQRIIHMLMV